MAERSETTHTYETRYDCGCTGEGLPQEIPERVGSYCHFHRRLVTPVTVVRTTTTSTISTAEIPIEDL